MPWTEKYRPKTLEEIQGQNQTILLIKNFIENFNIGKLTKNKKKALILHGPPGTGKTTLAHVIAKEMNSEIFELNASDLRNKKNLQEILKPAIQQKSLSNKSKIILVDEVDGISAVDRGGLTELLTLIELNPYPTIITANDVWGKKLSLLRKKAEIAQLKEIDYRIIKNVLIKILKKEEISLSEEIITRIAIQSKGDLRAAINDLQTISKVKDPSKVEFDNRNKETDIFNALRLIFKTKTTNEILKVFDSVNMSLDEIILWVEENIPLEYQGEELVRAYNSLSKADLFKGRIYKKQYWRFLVYEKIFLSFGISAAKKNIRTGFTNYKRPTRILKIWLNNQRTAKKKSISQKYASHVHVGAKRIMKEFIIIKQIIKNSPQIQKEIKLDQEEIEYLYNGKY